MIKCEIDNFENATITIDGERKELCTELVIIVAKLIEKGVLYDRDRHVLVNLLTNSPELAKRALNILREG